MLTAIGLVIAAPNLPEIDSLTDYRPRLPMRIYSEDGVLMGEYGEERRHFTPIAQIPKLMQDAVLAVEDAHFYEHKGVYYTGVLRAAIANLGRSRSQGASTITMQVARNFYLPTKKTFTRKIYEILLALKIENQLSKDQILEIYMNQIYLGQRAHGFAAASETYFGKPLADINLAEAALLAGLPQSPHGGNPVVNRERAVARQQHVLERMLANHFIDDAQRDAARRQALSFRAAPDVPVYADYVAETARQLIYSQYGDDAYRRGLNVYLTVNSAEQMAAYRALRRGILDYERRQTYRGPEDYVDLPADPAELETAIADALAEHPDNDELEAAVVVDVSSKKLEAVLQSGDHITVSGEGLKPAAAGLSDKATPKTQIRRGAVVRVVRAGRDWTLTQLPEVEGAFVSLDPQTGGVRAMVGGFDYSKNRFNHVTQAWRQPGSSIKPFIYSAALEKGFTPGTIINDAPLFFDAAATGSAPWEPKNFDGTFDGPMTMRTALAKSKNLVSVRILQAIGVPYAHEWLTRFGFDAERQPPYLTLALGAGSVTPMQLASAYAVFANGGYRVNPMLISKLTDANGRVLNEAKPPELDESMRVLEARNAFVMNSLLEEVARSGSAQRATALLKRADLAGKTGTTNDAVDAWFAGYQRQRVAVAWMGYDAPRKLGETARDTGSGLALPIWIDYMALALKGVPNAETVAPEGVVNLNGEWYYEEFTRRTGVSSVGLDDKPAPPGPSESDRKSILDMFRH
ncbi:MAG TPA: PBP1A family penicillin-binding protein [Albitalea sp.]|nr:PBP1A family penicillin-binding protein [Albitalea sp.]